MAVTIFTGDRERLHEVPSYMRGKILALGTHLEDVYVALNFYPGDGPRDGEIDVAIITPYSVHVIEIKRHRCKVLWASRNENWWCDSRSKPIKNPRGKGETPLQQTKRNRDQLVEALKEERLQYEGSAYGYLVFPYVSQCTGAEDLQRVRLFYSTKGVDRLFQLILKREESERRKGRLKAVPSEIEAFLIRKGLRLIPIEEFQSPPISFYFHLTRAILDTLIERHSLDFEKLKHEVHAYCIKWGRAYSGEDDFPPLEPIASRLAYILLYLPAHAHLVEYALQEFSELAYSAQKRAYSSQGLHIISLGGGLSFEIPALARWAWREEWSEGTVSFYTLHQGDMWDTVQRVIAKAVFTLFDAYFEIHPLYFERNSIPGSFASNSWAQFQEGLPPEGSQPLILLNYFFSNTRQQLEDVITSLSHLLEKYPNADVLMIEGRADWVSLEWFDVFSSLGIEIKDRAEPDEVKLPPEEEKGLLGPWLEIYTPKLISKPVIAWAVKRG